MTVEKLLRDMGAACARLQDETFRNLTSRRIQCDEIWSFIGAKEKNTSEEKKAQGSGDCWTWVAIDADSKLVPRWRTGPRDAATAYELMTDLASRLANRVQLTTDRPYLSAVEDAFGSDIEYAMLVKIYGSSGENETRYSPAKCLGGIPTPIAGDPDPKYLSTSYLERQNLTMRISMRRFTRLTNRFSKKIEMHARSVALHYAYCNFVKIHQTLRITPAMAAG